MKQYSRILSIFVIIAAASVFAAAQDTNKVEFFGGYSYMNFDTGLDDFDEDFFDSRAGMHGFNASITGNVSRRVGIKFDFSTHSKDLFDDGFTRVKGRNNQYMGGVQFKNNESDGPTLKPFAHILAGVANQRLSCEGDCFISDIEGVSSNFTETQNNFTMAFGGGLDVKVHRRVDIRVFQFDYNPTRFKGNDSLGTESFTQHNVRLGFGVVIH